MEGQLLTESSTQGVFTIGYESQEDLELWELLRIEVIISGKAGVWTPSVFFGWEGVMKKAEWRRRNPGMESKSSQLLLCGSSDTQTQTDTYSHTYTHTYTLVHIH